MPMQTAYSSHISSRVVGKRKNLRVHMRDREKEESPLDTMVGETECHVAFFLVFRIHHSCVVPIHHLSCGEWTGFSLLTGALHAPGLA